MSETKKLTEQELSEVVELRKEFSRIALSLGDIEIKKKKLNDELNIIDNEKNILLSKIDDLDKKEEELSKMLTNKYGEGSINLDTGEIVTV